MSLQLIFSPSWPGKILEDRCICSFRVPLSHDSLLPRYIRKLEIGTEFCQTALWYEDGGLSAVVADATGEPLRWATARELYGCIWRSGLRLDYMDSVAASVFNLLNHDHQVLLFWC